MSLSVLRDWHVVSGLVALAVLGAAETPAHSQTAVGANAARLTMQGPAESGGSNIIRDALNRPCLDVEAAARPHATNRDVVDHVVSVKNNCPRLIKMKVCYFNSDNCNSFDLTGYKRIDTVLGTMTGIKMFKYTIFQR